MRNAVLRSSFFISTRVMRDIIREIVLNLCRNGGEVSPNGWQTAKNRGEDATFIHLRLFFILHYFSVLLYDYYMCSKWVHTHPLPDFPTSPNLRGLPEQKVR